MPHVTKLKITIVYCSDLGYTVSLHLCALLIKRVLVPRNIVFFLLQHLQLANSTMPVYTINC